MKKTQKLQELRQKIDAIDGEIKKLLLKRLLIVKEIAAYKAKKGIKTFDKKRENLILQKIKNGFVKNILKKILSESKKHQALLKKKSKNAILNK